MRKLVMRPEGKVSLVDDNILFASSSPFAIERALIYRMLVDFRRLRGSAPPPPDPLVFVI